MADAQASDVASVLGVPLADYNDLRLVVMAAVAFNEGLPVLAGRDETAAAEMTGAIRRVARTVDLSYTGTGAPRG